MSFSKRRGWRLSSSATWHWVTAWAVTKVSRNRTAFVFSSKQSKKDGLFTSWPWGRRHHDPSTGRETLTQRHCVKILATSIRRSHAVHSEQVCLPTSNTGWIQWVEQTLPAELSPRTWTATPPEPRQPHRQHRSSWGPSRSSPASVGRPFPLLKHKFENPGSSVDTICAWDQMNWIVTPGTAVEEEYWTFVFYLSEIGSVVVSAVSVSVAIVTMSLLKYVFCLSTYSTTVHLTAEASMTSRPYSWR